LKYNNYILREREKERKREREKERERESYVMRLNVTTAQLVPNISNKLFLNMLKKLLLMYIHYILLIK